MAKISLLGCGWLGFPLAKALLSNGLSVKGSTTSESKLSILKSSGIDPFLITLSEVERSLDSKSMNDDIQSFLDGSETLIINIPPQLRGKNSDPSTANEKVFVE